MRADQPPAGRQRSAALRRRLRALSRLGRAEGGATAVEFAVVTPVLMLMFMAAVEVPRAIATSNRLDQATSALADLVASAAYADIADVYDAAQVVAAPYSLADAGIVLTAGGVYQVGNRFVARVCSSVQRHDQARAVGSDIGPPPPGTASKGDRFVMAEMRLAYRPLFSFFPILDGLTFTGKTVWPVREGANHNGQGEVILPGGKPCPP